MPSTINKQKVKKLISVGQASGNSGANYFFNFIPKLKTSFTLRNLFGLCDWADPTSFSDYVQVYKEKNFNTTLGWVQWQSPYASGDAISIIYQVTYAGEIYNAMTDIPSDEGEIVFLDLGSFYWDIGDVPIAGGAVFVQTLNANTDVALANGNRMLNPVAL